MRSPSRLVLALAEKHPNYLFARVVMARMLAAQGQAAEAREWLEPLNTRDRFHFSEFRAIAAANIEVLIADDQLDGAEAWVNMLLDADEDAWRDATIFRNRIAKVRREKRAQNRSKK